MRISSPVVPTRTGTSGRGSGSVASQGSRRRVTPSTVGCQVKPPWLPENAAACRRWVISSPARRMASAGTSRSRVRPSAFQGRPRRPKASSAVACDWAGVDPTGVPLCMMARCTSPRAGSAVRSVPVLMDPADSPPRTPGRGLHRTPRCCPGPTRAPRSDRGVQGCRWSGIRRRRRRKGQSSRTVRGGS